MEVEMINLMKFQNLELISSSMTKSRPCLKGLPNKWKRPKMRCKAKEFQIITARRVYKATLHLSKCIPSRICSTLTTKTCKS